MRWTRSAGPFAQHHSKKLHCSRAGSRSSTGVTLPQDPRSLHVPVAFSPVRTFIAPGIGNAVIDHAPFWFASPITSPCHFLLTLNGDYLLAKLDAMIFSPLPTCTVLHLCRFSIFGGTITASFKPFDLVGQGSSTKGEVVSEASRTNTARLSNRGPPSPAFTFIGSAESGQIVARPVRAILAEIHRRLIATYWRAKFRPIKTDSARL